MDGDLLRTIKGMLPDTHLDCSCHDKHKHLINATCWDSATPGITTLPQLPCSITFGKKPVPASTTEGFGINISWTRIILILLIICILVWLMYR